MPAGPERARPTLILVPVCVALLAPALARPARAQADAFDHAGHHYRLYANPDARAWANAAAFAAGLSVGGRPGYLARVDDAAENARLFQSVAANQAALTRAAPDGGGGRYVWIGANDRAAEGAWRWHGTDAQFWSGGPGGSAVGGLYSNWGSNQSGRTEPDNFQFAPAGQDAAGLSVNGWPLGAAGQWNDIGEQNPMPFFVEFDAPATPPPCRADFDGSGSADVSDIFAFLSAWFSQSIGSDFDASGATDVADIFAFLSAWFAGCP